MSHPTAEPIILVVGTRPEGIKMIPVYWELKAAQMPVLLCSTSQHNELLDDVFKAFNVMPDFQLSVMRQGQDLFYLTHAILQKTKELYARVCPALVLVQGDTTTAFAASLAAFYGQIPVGHIEAGLRTEDIYAPYPEEMNRRLITMLATYHFAPTENAVHNLLLSGVDPLRIWKTGNTGIDALRIMQDRLGVGVSLIRKDIQTFINAAAQHGKKIMILTLHRRETVPDLAGLLGTIKTWLREHPNVWCIYPYHPNPAIVDAIEKTGSAEMATLFLSEPCSYSDMVALLTVADFVVTDSGGIQEEAVSLGKKVIVVRVTTERGEGVQAQAAKLVGTDPIQLRAALDECLYSTYQGKPSTLYGNGYAARAIVSVIQQFLEEKKKYNDQKWIPVNKDLFPQESMDSDSKKIAVLGLGYIGLPTAIIACEHGFTVLGVDTDQSRVAAIQRGDPVIQEPEIFERLQPMLATGALRVSNAIAPADIFIIAVPTPVQANKQADLTYVYQAITMICSVIKLNDLIIVESTVPVGTTAHLAAMVEANTKLRVGRDFFIAYCPERVLPGKIFHELVHNARIIGGVTQLCASRAQQFYASFVLGQIHTTQAAAAEMVKLVENSSRDVQLAFAHQVAAMADAAGLNPYEVINLANKHPRVNILSPSCGVGGHCIAIDPWFLVQTFPEQSQLLHEARRVNDAQPVFVAGRIKNAVKAWQKNNKGICKIALLGLTYKPNVDDMRESPALAVAQQIVGIPDAQLYVCEPHVAREKIALEGSYQSVSIAQGIECADVIVFLVAHTRFAAIDHKLLRKKMVLDFCGILSTAAGSSTHDFVVWPVQSTLEPKMYANHKPDITNQGAMP